MQHLIGTFDHVSGHVALMRHAHISHGLAANKAIATHETEHAGQHLVVAGTILRVQQDDFVGLASGIDLANMAKPDHVLVIVVPVVMAGTGLRHHEGLKPFLAQFGQHRGDGDIGVTLGTAFVGRFRKDGRGRAVSLVIGQRGNHCAAPGNGNGMRAWSFS